MGGRGGISQAKVAFPGKTSETGNQEQGSVERKEGRREGGREVVGLCQQGGGRVSRGESDQA